MSQTAVKRFYLMQVGSMPEYQIPIVCYLVQTGDGKNMLIDSGLPERFCCNQMGRANDQPVNKWGNWSCTVYDVEARRHDAMDILGLAGSSSAATTADAALLPAHRAPSPIIAFRMT